MIKPIKVTPMDNYILKVHFNNGECKLFDLKPYLDMPFYSSLKDKEQFMQVYVGEYTIEWKNGRDISPHELYEYSTPFLESAV